MNYQELRTIMYLFLVTDVMNFQRVTKNCGGRVPFSCYHKTQVNYEPCFKLWLKSGRTKLHFHWSFSQAWRSQHTPNTVVRFPFPPRPSEENQISKMYEVSLLQTRLSGKSRAHIPFHHCKTENTHTTAGQVPVIFQIITRLIFLLTVPAPQGFTTLFPCILKLISANFNFSFNI